MLNEERIAQKLTEIEEAYPKIKDLYKRYELLGISLALLTVLEATGEVYWNDRMSSLTGEN